MKIPIGMMKIPQSAQFIAGEIIQQAAQAGSVCIDSRCFYQQTDAAFTNYRKNLVQMISDCIFMICQRTDNKLGNVQGFRCINQELQMIHVD